MSFWSEADDKHQQIAKTFYEHIEYHHPTHLSGRSKRGISSCNCSWCATRVKYPNYTGPRITNL